MRNRQCHWITQMVGGRCARKTLMAEMVKSRGKNGEDKDAAMGVKEVQEDKMEEDYKEKGQEVKQEDEQ